MLWFKRAFFNVALQLALILFMPQASARTFAPDFMELSGANSSIDKAIEGLQSLIEQARNAAFAIEAQTNKDVKDRLDQINSIIRDAISDLKSAEDKTAEDIDRIAGKYILQISGLEAQFTRDLSGIIDQATCAVDKSLNDSLRDALGGLGRALNSNSLEITPPIMYPGEQSCSWLRRCGPVTRTFKIREPFSATFVEVRDYLNQRLETMSRDDTPIASVLVSYSMIANLAKRAGCHTNEFAAYTEVYIEYINKVRLWQRVAGVKAIIPASGAVQ